MNYQTRGKIFSFTVGILYAAMCMGLLLWAVSDRRKQKTVQHHTTNCVRINNLCIKGEKN